MSRKADMVRDARVDDPGRPGVEARPGDVASLLAGSPAAVVAVDLRQTVTEWNPAAERLFGWRWQEVLGRRDPTVADDVTYAPLFRRAADGEAITGVTLYGLRHDRSVLELGGSLIPLRNREGEVVTVVKMLADQSADAKSAKALRRRAAATESRLRESQALLASVLESSLTGLMVFQAVRNVAGAIVDFEWLLVNPAGLRSSGRALSDFVGHRLSEVYPESWDLGLFERYVRVVESGEPMAFEQRYERDAQARWTMASLVKIGDGLAVSFDDITESRRAHEAMVRTEQFFNAVFEGSPVAIQIYDPDGTSRRLNEAQRRLLGLPSLDYGVGVYNVLTDRLTQEYGISDRFRQALRGQVVEHANQVVDLAHPDNHWATDRRRIVFNQVFFPIHDERGAVKAVVAMAWDNTARAEAERALRQLAQAQSDFISTVSHELRTPLTSIRGALSLLAGGVAGPLPEPSRALVDIALRNSERLLALINDLLDIQRIESGNLELNMAEVELTSLIEQALEDNQAFGAQLGVTFRLIHGEPSLRVLGDRNRLLQLMANLLSNAAKFSPPQGNVEIAVERLDGRARVSVHDHGQGIPEEFRPRIFSRFAQADSSSTRQKGGTGLGLSICKALVERMGGTIGFETRSEAEAATDYGTTFHFELPLLGEPAGN
jgi:PAS domain S-box-containing protein